MVRISAVVTLLRQCESVGIGTYSPDLASVSSAAGAFHWRSARGVESPPSIPTDWARSDKNEEWYVWRRSLRNGNFFERDVRDFEGFDNFLSGRWWISLLVQGDHEALLVGTARGFIACLQIWISATSKNILELQYDLIGSKVVLHPCEIDYGNQFSVFWKLHEQNSRLIGSYLVSAISI
jgi:hypothetical protein